MSDHLFIATALGKLLDMPLQSREDLAQWCTEAQELQRQLKRLKVEIPEEIWHFLADADIRVRPEEGAYCQRQEAAVRGFVAQLQGSAHAS